MPALAFNQAYIDKANEALSLALSRGLNNVSKPSIDVQILLDAIGGGYTGTQQYNFITVAYSQPAGVTDQIWLDANPASTTYKEFFIFASNTWQALDSSSLTDNPHALVPAAVAAAIGVSNAPNMVESVNTGITTSVVGSGTLSASGNTWQTIIGARSKFWQVRVGYVNYNQAADYTITRASVTPSTTFVAAGTDPTGGTPVALTFDGGQASKVIKGYPTVLEDTTTWSDWVDCAALERTDVPGAPYLIHIRTFFAQNGGYNYNGAGTTSLYSGNTTTGLVRLGCGWMSGDKITSPTGYTGGASLNNNLDLFIEFRTSSRVIRVGQTGDSITAGGSTPSGSSYACFGAQAVALLNAKTDAFVYDIRNYGIGATTHANFYGRLPRILRRQQFDIFLLPIDSPNSPVNTQAAFDSQVARTLRGIQQVQAHGAVPILWTSTPHGNTSTIEGFRLQTDALWRQLAAANDWILVDLDPYLSDHATPGASWISGLSNDNLHPNDAGTAVMAAQFAPAIEKARARLTRGYLTREGTTINDDAPLGEIGEVVLATVASGSAVSLSNATTANVTSISLSAGDWDVDSTVDFTLTGATVTVLQCGASTTTATLPTQAGTANIGPDGLTSRLSTLTTATGTHQERSRVRLKLGATTTVYLTAQTSFSAGTVAAYGTISARRAR